MRKTKFNRSRSLQIESLENRELLSVSPLNVGFESQDAALVAEAVYVDAAEAPAAPGNLNVEPGTGRNFVLNWDAVAGATSYEVEVQFGDRAPYKLPYAGNATSYVTPSFPVGEVTFSVYALDADGERSIAAEETGTVIAPTNPANFSAKALPNRQVELTWDAAPGASYYQIYYQNASGDFVNLMQSKTNSCTTTRVAVGDAVFRIATVAPGITPNVATAREAATTIAEPTAPAGINAVALPDGSIELTWNAVPGANYYQAMLVGQNGAEQSLGTTADTTFTTRAFANGEYTLRLYTFSAKVKSDAAEFTVNVAEAPAAPTGLRGTAQTNRVVNLTWNAVENATAYQVYWENAAGVVQLAATVTGTSYGGRMFPSGDNTFFVRALNEDTVSEASDSVIVTNAAPATPQNLEAVQVSVPGTQRRDFDLTWDAVTGASSYQISRRIGTGNWVVVKTVSTNSCRTPSFPLEADVELRVVAIAPGAQSTPATITVTVEKQTVTPPTAPALSSTATTQNSVTLAWAAQTGLTGYSLRYKVNNTADWTAYAGTIAVTAEGVTVTGLEANTSYDFQLTASNSEGDATSNSLTVKTAADPTVSLPGAITAANIQYTQTGDGTVKLTFPAVDGATSYTVYNAAGTTVVKEGLVYADGGIIVSGVSNASFRIAAKNTAGEGTQTTFTLTGILDKVTTAIEATPVQTAAGTITFSVDETNFVVDKVTGIVIRTRIGGSGAYIDLPAGVTATADMKTGVVTVTGLTTGTSYQFTAALVNIAGEGNQSVGSTAVSIVAAPAAPTNVVATKDATVTNTVNITWTAPAAAPTSYKVEYSTDGTTWVKVTDTIANDTKASVSNLTAGVYQFRVTSFSGADGAGIAGTSVLAAESVTVSAADAVPAAPVINAEQSKQTGNEEYTLVWGAVYGATGYEVSMNDGTATAWTDIGTATTYKFTGVDDATVFSVRAKNAKGISTVASTVRTTLVKVPNAPTSVSAVQRTTSSVTVTIKAAAADATYGAADTVVLYVQTGGGGTYAAIPAEQVTITRGEGTNANVFTAIVTGLNVGTVYRFGATAKNAANEGEQTNPVNTITLLNPPTAPTELTVEQKGGMNAEVKWVAPTGGADSYKVSYYDGTKWVDAVDSTPQTPTEITITNLAAGNYSVRVSSVSSTAGDGAYVETTFTVVGKLPAATNVKAVQTADGEVTLTWDAVSGATGYKVIWAIAGGANGTLSVAPAGGQVTTMKQDSDIGADDKVTYYVVATNVAGDSDKPSTTLTTSYAEVTLVAAAVEPTGNPAKQTAPGTVQITVGNYAATYAETYNVYMRTGSGEFVLQTQNVEVVKGTDGKLTGVINVTGLSTGVSYAFQVTAKNVINETDPSKSAFGTVTIVAELTAPTEIAAVRTTGENKITVTWKAVEGAEKYNVYLSDDGGTTWQDAASVSGGTAVTYTSGVLTYSPNWVAKVAAVDTVAGVDIEGIQSVQSASLQLVTGIDVTKKLALEAPEILTATQSGTTVTLTWKVVPGAASYLVYSGSDDDFSVTVGTTIPTTGVTFETVNGIVTATIAGASASNDYFKVAAIPNEDTAGTSYLTNSIASAQKFLDVVAVQGAPTLNAADQDLKKVGTVTLTMNVDVPTGETVNVYYRKDGSSSQVAVSAANISIGKDGNGDNTAVITVTGLEPGTYQFVVSYTNAAGESSQSGSQTETVVVSDKISTLVNTTDTGNPDEFAWVNTDQKVTLTFEGGASADAAGTYALYYASATPPQAGSNPVWTLITGTETAIVSGDLTKDITFKLRSSVASTLAAGDYVVIAVKKPATGAPTNALPYTSTTLNGDAVEFTKPTASDTPTLSGNLTAAAGQTITLTFPGGASSAAAKTYTVYYTSNSGTTWTATTATVTVAAGAEEATTTAFTLASLMNTPGKYEFAVFTTAPSDGTTVVPANALTLTVLQPVPANLTSTAKTDTTVTLGWTANATATGYSIQWKASSVTDWDAQTGVTTVTVDGQATVSQMISGLTANTAYDFRIAAADANGTGAYGTQVSVTTALATPANFAGESAANGESVDLTWDAVTGAAGYTVEYSTDNGSNWIGTQSVATNSASVTSLSPTTPYQFRVQATNGSGNTSAYATVSITTATP